MVLTSPVGITTEPASTDTPESEREYWNRAKSRKFKRCLDLRIGQSHQCKARSSGTDGWQTSQSGVCLIHTGEWFPSSDGDHGESFPTTTGHSSAGACVVRWMGFVGIKGFRLVASSIGCIISQNLGAFLNQHVSFYI